MKRIFCICLCALLVLPGCAYRSDHVLAVFREGFCAEVQGEINGQAFAAYYEASALTAEGVLPVTVTFYAPAGLSGAVLTQNASGEVSLSLADMQVSEGTVGLLPLLEVFPTSEVITAITVSDIGHTVVEGDGFSAELLADGTPVLLCRGTVRLQVVRWEKS